MEETQLGNRPNILFVFPDQHRFDWRSDHPALDLRTPALDSLTAGGVRFDRAICPSPLCAPSRACLAAGREYRRLAVRNNQQNFPADVPTFYQSLRDAGYQVGSCGKLDLDKARSDWGLDGRKHIAEWGFTHGLDSAGKWDAVNSGHAVPLDPYMAALHAAGQAATHVADMRRRKDKFAVHPTPLPDDLYGDNWVGARAREILASFTPGRPWFLQVNFPGPHDPWDVTAAMLASVAGRRMPPVIAPGTGTIDQHVAVRRNYTAMVENIDRHLGLMLAALRERGEFSNTVVIYSSDHGEMLGDHGQWGKSRPWQPSVGVPLILRAPGVRAGTRVAAPVNLIDLAATILDYAGQPDLPDWDSRSLRPLAEGRADTVRDVVRSGLNDWQSVQDTEWKLVVAGDDVQLFNLIADPDELKNLAGQRADVAARLRANLYSPEETKEIVPMESETDWRQSHR